MNRLRQWWGSESWWRIGLEMPGLCTTRSWSCLEAICLDLTALDLRRSIIWIALDYYYSIVVGTECFEEWVLVSSSSRSREFEFLSRFWPYFFSAAGAVSYFLFTVEIWGWSCTSTLVIYNQHDQSSWALRSHRKSQEGRKDSSYCWLIDWLIDFFFKKKGTT